MFHPPRRSLCFGIALVTSLSFSGLMGGFQQAAAQSYPANPIRIVVPTAPGLFSTMTRQPSALVSAVAMTRLMMSGGVLGAVGTTIRIGLAG